MKVGLILECAPGGADQQVCEHFLKVLNPKLDPTSRTLVNKARLKAQCGDAARELLADGCGRIGIVWDLFPPWRQNPDDEHSRCLDCLDINKSLVAAGVEGAPIELICITEELEAWMLSDERALYAVLHRRTRKWKEKRVKNPERVSNPKRVLCKLFEKHCGGRRYADMVDAIHIARAMPDLSRLASCPSFVRFAGRLANVNLVE